MVYNLFSMSDFPRVTVGPENPLRVERDDTAELKCSVDSKPGVKEVNDLNLILWGGGGKLIM